MIDLKTEVRNELRADIAARKADYTSGIMGALREALDRVEGHPDFKQGIAFLFFKVAVLK
jgi:hypothetical protein